ncbi:hypothetical protein [Streptomyces sp. MB09-02B]|uniref:hypothetical protein n=1 Tax=Streptomyces sp. MB09-02B TaxID=3028667 RepID=UPI0029BD8307|nr:hypothetical protein [Streptomyces sp. MB09-02B]MDX3640824.1 hypothetical protein [Streptomyces sp. MB09-02B]
MPNKKDKEAGALVRKIVYFLCHTRPHATLAELITAAGQRSMAEEAFQAAKGQAGLDEYEVRKWLVVLTHHRVHARHGIPQRRPEPPHTRPANATRPPNRERIRRLYDRIVLARTTRTAGAPATRSEPAPATTAPEPPARTHRETTGCSTEGSQRSNTWILCRALVPRA